MELDTVAKTPAITAINISGNGSITGLFEEEGVVFIDANKNGRLDTGELSATILNNVSSNPSWTLSLNSQLVAQMTEKDQQRNGNTVTDGFISLGFVDKAGNILDNPAELYYFNNREGQSGTLSPIDRPETATVTMTGNQQTTEFKDNSSQIIFVTGDISADNVGKFIIKTGLGNDILNVNGNLQKNVVVDMGEGNDTYVGSKILGGSNRGDTILDMGNGDNKIITTNTNEQAIRQVTINSGDGDDIIDAKGGIQFSNINLGGGNNKITTGGLGTIDDTVITFGKGNDIVDTGASASNKGYIENGSIINMGEGDDYVKATGVNNDSKVYMEDGNDTVYLFKEWSVGGGNPVIDMGNGDDTFIFNLYYNNLDYRDGGIIQGGAGIDTLAVESSNYFGNGNNANRSVTLGHDTNSGIQGFEYIDLTAEGRQTVNISIGDVLGSGAINNTIYVTGNRDDRVDFDNPSNYQKNALKTHSHVGMDGVEHTYTAYERSVSGAVAETIYIDDNIINAGNII